MEPQEIEMQGVNVPVDEEAIVGKKEPKIANKAHKKGNASVINWLEFKNIAVIYKDELGHLERVRINLTIPQVEKNWYQPAIRKRLSLWFDDQNVLPTQILQVSLPSSGATEKEEAAPFLDKPIGEFTKEDCVNAAIYWRLRTVVSALSADVERMQESVWLHYNNQAKLNSEQFLNGERIWDFPVFDPKAKLK